MNLFQLSFYTAIAFTIVGCGLGLLGVWLEDFWRNDVAWKLVVTDMILVGTSLVVAVITKFLAT